MKIYIKQIKWQAIVLSLIASIGYLSIVILHLHLDWITWSEAGLTSLLFFVLAAMLFYANLCDILKRKIDRYENQYRFDEQGKIFKRIIDD